MIRTITLARLVAARRVGLAVAMLCGGFAVGCATLLGFEDFHGREVASGGAAGVPATAGAAGGGVEATGGASGGTGGQPSHEGGSAGARVCEPGSFSCGGGEVRLLAQQCNDDGAGWIRASCVEPNGQCNPRTGACIALGIDPTEVTRAAYQEFLTAMATDPPPAVAQTPGCAYKSGSFLPDADCLNDRSVCTDDCDNHPQVCVDWCDAAAYCDWAGEHLCGRIGTGDLVDFDSGYLDPSASEWMNACTAGGQFDYGTGPEAPRSEPGACTFAGGTTTTYPVGSQAGCASTAVGYESILDLSGNVAEWENACTAAYQSDAAGPDDVCRTRGSAFRCDVVPADTVTRRYRSPTLGFRCCSG